MEVYSTQFATIQVNLEFGCSSNQVSSSTNDTADYDWQQSEDKSYCTRSSDSVSDS
jgi:hypothetical protein